MLTPTWSPFTRIARPLESHGVRSPEQYLAWQAALIRNNRQRLPGRQWRDPFTSTLPVVPFVNGGRWVVICADCLNLAIYDPDWRLACCAECGAIYRDVSPPADATLIEAVLMARPASSQRHWNTEATLQVGAPESLVDLAIQNTREGHAVPSELADGVERALGAVADKEGGR